ncbi:MAG: hypothetical protein LBJ11_00900 [Oscillospiraceae bacterium]|jgi:hypothetical protein|nr:hypothetical protein [Oscillospiraceae bacterium]
MKQTKRLLLAFVAVFLTVAMLGALGACQHGGKDKPTESPEITKPAEGTDGEGQGWSALVSSPEQVQTPLTQNELKTIVEQVLKRQKAASFGGGTLTDAQRAEIDAITWDGDWSKLDQAQKDLVVKEIKDTTGYDVVIDTFGPKYQMTERSTARGAALPPPRDEKNRVIPTDAAGVQIPTDANLQPLPTVKPGVPAPTQPPPTNPNGGPVAEPPGKGNINVVTDPPTTKKNDTAPSLTGAQRQNLTTFGGKGHQRFTKVIPAADGGWLALALVDSQAPGIPAGLKDYASAVIKYSATGAEQWKRYYGGSMEFDFEDLTQLKDGSIVAVGWTFSKNLSVPTSPGLNSDAVMAKLSASGEQIWLKSAIGSREDGFTAVNATPDGGFVVGGYTSSADQDFVGLPDFITQVGDVVRTVAAEKALILKYDANGTVYWKRALTGTRASRISAVAAEIAGGAVYVAINTSATDYDFQNITGAGQQDALLMRLNKNGETEWIKPFAGRGEDSIRDLAVTPDGGVAVAAVVSMISYRSGSFSGELGSAFAARGQRDAVALKYRANGTVAWIRSYGDVTDDYATGIAVIDGGYVLAGYSTDPVLQQKFKYDWLDHQYMGGEQDGFLYILGEDGRPIRMMNLSGEGKDWVNAVAAKDGKTFALAGSSPSRQGFLAEANPQGRDLDHVGFLSVYQATWSK